jgi:hypothetical protein
MIWPRKRQFVMILTRQAADAVCQHRERNQLPKTLTMTRPLFCILLLAILGLTRIALADAAQDVMKTRYELHVALKRAVLDIVEKGERDPGTIASVAMERTQTERIQFMKARVAEGLKGGQSRSDAEITAKDEIKEMLDSIIDGVL